MKLKDLVEESVYLYEDRSAIELVSGPGLGKSETVEHDIIAKLSEHYGEPFGCVTENLANRDHPDIGGFMVPSKDADGRAVSMYTVPYIMHQIEKQVALGYKRGILFLDEFRQCDHLVQKAVSALILSGRLGEWTIPEGWWTVLASNRTEDGAGANKQLTHNINRKGEIPMEFDLDGLCEYGQRPHVMVHPMVEAFWRARPGLIYSETVPKEAKQGKPYSTPRSQVSAARYLRIKLGNNPDSMHIPDDARTQEVIRGRVGDAVAAEMFAFFKVANELPTIEEIIADPAKAKRPDDTRLDAQYAAMTMAVYHADQQNVNSVFQYITRLCREMQTTAAKTLLEKEGGALLNSPALSDWIAKNKTLIMQTVSGS